MARIPLFLLTGLALSACTVEPSVPAPLTTDTGDGPQTTDDTGTAVTDPAPEVPQGVWQFTSGSDPFGTELAGLDYIEFGTLTGDGGTFDVFGRESTIQITNCLGGVFTPVGDQTMRTSVANGNGGATERLVVFELDGSTLTMTAAGATATFTEASSIPQESRCGEATLLNELPIELPAYTTSYYYGPTGLIGFDGTNLLVQAQNETVIPFSPVDGSPSGKPVQLDPTYDELVAMEGTAIWARAGSTRLGRLDPSPVIVDEIDLQAKPLNLLFSIRAVAHDGTNLLVNGRNSRSGQFELLTINHQAEPDAVVSAVETGIDFRDLIFSKGTLWGLTSVGGEWALLEIDPVDGSVGLTVKLPSKVRNEGLDSLATTGSTVFAAGSDYYYGGLRVFELELPAL